MLKLVVLIVQLALIVREVHLSQAYVMKASSVLKEVLYKMDIQKSMLLGEQTLDSVQKAILAQLELMHQFHVNLELMVHMNKLQLVNHAQQETIVMNAL